MDCSDCDELLCDDENVSNYLYDKLDYDLNEITEIVEEYRNGYLIKNENTDDQLLIDLSGEHWIDFPDRKTSSECMMKLVRRLENGSLYIDLKRNLVFV